MARKEGSRYGGTHIWKKKIITWTLKCIIVNNDPDLDQMLSRLKRLCDPEEISYFDSIRFKYLFNLQFSSALGTHYKLEACLVMWVKVQDYSSYSHIIKGFWKHVYSNHYLQKHQLFIFNFEFGLHLTNGLIFVYFIYCINFH